MGRRRSIWRIRASGLADSIERCTFDTYKASEPWQINAKQTAMNYIDDYYARWFCALGDVGSGKTHLCTAICGELMKRGDEVRYMRWRDDAPRIKAAVNDSEEYERLVEPLKRVKVLYIDDFLKAQTVSQGDINLAFEILDHRYINRKLVTIISAEKTVGQITKIDEAIGSRIFERSRDYCLNIRGEGRNWRLK